MSSRNAASFLYGVSMLINACVRAYESLRDVKVQVDKQRHQAMGGERDEKSNKGRGVGMEKDV